MKTYLLGFGLSMLHLQRGEMAIHCAAVSKGDKAYLVAGESGSGKSTLTTRFLEEGFSLMADDCAVVAADESGRVKVYPAFPFQKLCRDVVKEKGLDIEQLIYINEEKDKFLVPYEGEFSTEGVPFAGMFCLAVDPKIENCVMQLVEGISKLHFCVGNLFLRRLLWHGMITPKLHFECLKLIGNVPVHFILRPEKGDTLEKIWAYIENCLAE